MYPHLKESLKVHYIDNYGIVIGGKNKYLSDIDVYILDKLDGEKSIDNVINDIVLELGSDDRNQISDIMNQFLENNKSILTFNDKPSKYTMKHTGEKNKKYPYYIIFSITNSCNLTCKHCFKSCNISNKDFIPYERLMSTLKCLAGKTPGIQLTGGEPMLHNRFLDILRYSKENFDVNITTSATLINEKNAHEFKGVSGVQISLYSHKEDEHEYVTSTKDSYNKTINGIKELVKNDVNVSIAMIATKNKIDEIEEMAKFLISIGVKKLTVGAFSKCGRGLNLDDSWLLSKEDHIVVENKLKELNSKYKGEIDITKWEDSSSELKIEKQDKEEFIEEEVKEERFNCGAGTSSWSISEKGNIKPCDFFPEELFSYGNIIDNDIDDIVANYKLYGLKNKVEQWNKQLENKNSSVSNVCKMIEEFRIRNTEVTA
ncbi:radical SAM/SPASM domain-containing protein [Abyssisolibacter fermentans]|uniref:radical SAM/SPASM domain-containing protein n=1 Tax=Abyssisolibacter fermentans TaxID=1766203 RepID=UPI00082C9F67|nr:radical SAM protein [Abyssisolibacter fermentans]